MVSHNYFAVCPTETLLAELNRLGLIGHGVEACLYSKKQFDRVHIPPADQVQQVRSTYFAMFSEFLRDHEVDSEPFSRQFDDFWKIQVFEDCEDVDDSLIRRN